MKKIMILFVLFFCAFNLSAQTNSDKVDENVVKNVVLINKSPWEVLMSKNGDILAKINNIPNYLDGVEKGKLTNKPVLIANTKSIVNNKQNHAIKEEIVNIKSADEAMLTASRLEVVFNSGSALLNSSQIKFLDGIASKLNSNSKLKFKLYSFNNEPEYRSFLLGKRRQDAVLGYLKIKGVNINTQIVIGNEVKGKNNKIVFAETR